MQQDRQVGTALDGMAKDTHPTLLGEKSYIHALNALYENKDGDAVRLQNEDSNFLCSKFKSGFKVIGFTLDILNDRVYFFLVNPTTNQSEIGFINNPTDVQSLPDDTILECNCDIESILSAGLENLTQVESCTYTTLIKDYDCPGSTEGEGCLNFNINYPISSVIKPEKLGDVIYFTDDLNPLRRIEVEDIAQYSKKGVFCQDNGILAFSNSLPIPVTYADGTYSVYATTTSGSGAGVELEIVVASSNITTITITDTGTGYEVNDTITINGSVFNSPTNLTLTVSQVDTECDCGLKEVDVCINCEKLYIVPAHEQICLEILGTVPGGKLEHGQYTFYAGYCSKDGEMITPYMAVSEAASVKDPNTDIYIQPTLDAVTNLSIKVGVSNLSADFEYYKVAVRSINAIEGRERILEVGVFSTSTKEIIHSGSTDLNSIDDIRVIFDRVPDYTKAKLVTKTNNTLFFADLEARPDPNLQPVVNFMGEFMTWRSSIADEDLYQTSRATAQFRGYLRDEVYALGIRFITNEGYSTPVYPLVSRYKTDNDVLFDPSNYPSLELQTEEIDDILGETSPPTDSDGWKRDVYSTLINGTEDCGGTLRRQKWQFYNTASRFTGRLYELDLCASTYEIEYEPKLIERKCVKNWSERVIQYPIILDQFQDGDEFTSLFDYIENTPFSLLPPTLQNTINALELQATDSTTGTPCNSCADDVLDAFPINPDTGQPCVTSMDDVTLTSSEFFLTGTGLSCPEDSTEIDQNKECTTDALSIINEQEGCQLIETRTYVDCDTGYYQRLNPPTECEDTYTFNLSQINDDNEVEIKGKQINDGTYNFWLKRNRAASDNCDNDPALFERVTNYLNNTTFQQATSFSPIAYDPLNELDVAHIGFLFPAPNDPPTSPRTYNQIKEQLVSTTSVNKFTFPTVGNTASSKSQVLRNFDNERCKCSEAPDDYNNAYRPEDAQSRFEERVHQNALWYEMVDIDTPFVVVDISSLKKPIDKRQDCALYGRYLRVSVFDKNLQLLWTVDNHDACNLVRMSGDSSYQLDQEGAADLGINTFYSESSRGAGLPANENTGVAYPVGANGPLIVAKDGKICVKTEYDVDKDTGEKRDEPGANTVKAQVEELYITIETPIIITANSFSTSPGGGLVADNLQDPEDNSQWDSTTNPTKYQAYATATENCFRFAVYRPVLDRVELNLPSYTPPLSQLFIRATSVCKYAALCCVPEDKKIQCDPIPNQHGRFGYWESIVTYPNNENLYNSQNMITDISSLDLSFLDNTELETVRDDFYDYYTTDGSQLANTADFSCKPIRHFKFPDVQIAPHMYDEGYSTVGQFNKICPLGFYLDNRVINAFLDLAVDKSLIDQDFRSSISNYEIFRSDAESNQSIIAKGVLYDMIPYTEEAIGTSSQAYTANFPYNDYSDNTLIYLDDEFTQPLTHPDSVNGANDRFSFFSPETMLNQPALPFEMYTEAYMAGHSTGVFARVDNHPEMAVLTDRAYELARRLATSQIVLNLLANLSEYISKVVVGTSTNIGGYIAVALYTASNTANAYAEARGKIESWLEILRNLAKPSNFAHYYTSLGLYNRLEDYEFSQIEGNKLRGLNERFYLGAGRVRINEAGEPTSSLINNFLRESSVYLNTGITVQPPAGFTQIDDSRFTARETNCGNTNISSEKTASIASQYVSLKSFITNQYGNISNVRWRHISYCGNLEQSNACDIIYGGDIFISRFWFKRKYPFFTKWMMNGESRLADLTPFKYSVQRNVGYPKYYIDYLAGEKEPGRFLGVDMRIPYLSSDYELDCLDVTKPNSSKVSTYVQEGSKFYLAYYGIPGVLVESRINLNYRYGENSRDKGFYPGVSDYITWTQERNVSISEDNFLFYNEIYSQPKGLFPYRTLKDGYDPAEEALRFDHHDRVIYSLADDDENDIFDRFRIFQEGNKNDFGTKYGELIGITNIESEKILVRFENGSAIFNAYNTLQGSQEQVIREQTLGTGSIFKRTRPEEFFRTELGYGGTQHRAIVTSQYGHYWVDAKRGRVFSVAPGGGGITEVSQKGMKNWFRENLPFKIKEQFPEIPREMLDNEYDSLGIAMVYDDRFTRIFVTKLDCKVKSSILVYTGPESGIIPNNSIRIKDLDFVYRNASGVDAIVNPKDTVYFDQASWTAAYCPQTETWVSFYSFLPNYYVPHQNYFSSGLNYGTSDEIGIWNHLLGKNRSFQVFYGTLYPWIIETPIKPNFQTKIYQDLSYRLDVRRYINENDYAYREENFDSIVLYNDRESTGLLNLTTQVPNSQLQLVQFPKFNNNSIDILATNDNYTWSVNYFFDNLRENHTLPIWNHALNKVDKTLNNTAFNYAPTFKNHIRGQYLITRYTQSDESRLKFIFEHFVVDSNMYDAY